MFYRMILLFYSCNRLNILTRPAKKKKKTVHFYRKTITVCIVLQFRCVILPGVHILKDELSFLGIIDDGLQDIACRPYAPGVCRSQEKRRAMPMKHYQAGWRQGATARKY